MKELVQARPSASLSRKRVQEPCLFIRPRVIMRCQRVWVRTRVKIFRLALPARLINDIFERQDAQRTCVRRYVAVTCPMRKTTRIRDPEREGYPGKEEKKCGMPRSFDYYLSISKLRDALVRPSRSLTAINRDDCFGGYAIFEL